MALRLVAHDPPDVSFANAGVQAPQAPATPQELRLSGLSLVPGVEAQWLQRGIVLLKMRACWRNDARLEYVGMIKRRNLVIIIIV